MQENIKTIIKHKRLSKKRCNQLQMGWDKKVCLRYHDYRKKAEKESSPGINLLMAALYQAYYDRDRWYIDHVIPLVEENVPKDDLFRHTGAVLCCLGFGEEGIKKLRQAVEIAPEEKNLRGLALRLYRPEDYYEKLSIIDRLLPDHSNDLQLLKLKATVLWNFKRYDEAEAIINHALSLSQKDARIREVAADIYIEKEQFDLAYDHYEKAYKYGIPHFRRQVFARMVCCSYLAGRAVKKNRKRLKRWMKRHIDVPNIDWALDVLNGRRRIGVEFYKLNKFSVKVYYYLKREAEDEERPGEATLFYSAMKSVKVNDIQILLRAIDAVGDTVSKDLILRVTGRTKCLLGDVDEGIADLVQAIDINASKDNVICLVESLMELERFKEAERYIKQCLGDQKDDFDMLWRLGTVLENYNDSEALEVFQKAANIEPDQMFVRYYMGRCLLWMGRFDEALEQLEASRHLRYPENPCAISIEVSRCYAALSNLEKAKEHAQRAVVEDPSSKEAQELLEALGGRKD